MAYVPQVGDTGVTGVIQRVWANGGGIACADQVQGEPGTVYDGPPNVSCNPLQFQFYSGSFCVGQRVTFSVAQGPFGPYAVSVVAY